MEDIIRQGLAALGVPADGAQIGAMARYGTLLLKANETTNLTAITEPAAAARLHFLDSAAQASRTKSIFFPTLSRHVKSMSGVRMRRGTPGKPAPEPTSMTFFPAKSATVISAALSRKWSLAAAAGSVMG